MRYVMDLKYESDLKTINIYILDPKLRKTYKAYLIYTYDGTNWIKASGGKSLHTDQLKFLHSDDIKKIKEWFKR